jgi:general secretion pathway protein G
MRRSRARGFTFLEIMVVVAILAILAGLIIPRFVGRAEEARKTKAIVQMKEIMKALELYKLDNGKYPTTEQGLLALVEEPTGEPKPRKWRQYLDKIPVDPWKGNFVYLCPGADHGRKGDADREKNEGKYGYFDLLCYGPDGVESEDDIVSWNMPEE